VRCQSPLTRRYDKEALELDTLSRLLRQNAAILIAVLTLIVLTIHPIPECVDCEFPTPWGRNDVVYDRDSNLLALWLILASFLASLCTFKWSWFVPLGIVLAHAVTQLRGGVPWWSLSGNEGPIILIVGLVVGSSSFMLGHLAQRLYRSVRRSLNTQRA
jgi:hypothetical protein